MFLWFESIRVPMPSSKERHRTAWTPMISKIAQRFRRNMKELCLLCLLCFLCLGTVCNFSRESRRTRPCLKVHLRGSAGCGDTHGARGSRVQSHRAGATRSNSKRVHVAVVPVVPCESYIMLYQSISFIISIDCFQLWHTFSSCRDLNAMWAAF